MLKATNKEQHMDEKALLTLWNDKRSAIIKAQLAPSLVLIGVFVLSGYGKFSMATNQTKYLTLGVVAATGILAMISQYAAIREAEALINDLKKIQNPSALAKKVAESRALLSLSATAMVAFGIGIFALVAWAILA
jgi:hypothetical protein